MTLTGCQNIIDQLFSLFIWNFENYYLIPAYFYLHVVFVSWPVTNSIQLTGSDSICSSRQWPDMINMTTYTTGHDQIESLMSDCAAMSGSYAAVFTFCPIHACYDDRYCGLDQRLAHRMDAVYQVIRCTPPSMEWEKKSNIQKIILYSLPQC